MILWQQLFRPTNRRIRLLVGLLLAGLFCIQCTRSEAFRESKYIVAISGKEFGQNAPEVAFALEKMAKTDHIALLEHCLDNYSRSYRDFTCTFIKQERIHGTLRPAQEIAVKHMASPFSVAMTFNKNAPIADRVLYVEDKFNNQMLVRPTSPLLQILVGGAVLRKPDGPEAMKNTLRPVNMFGFGRALDSLLKVYRQASERGDLKTDFGKYAEVAGRKCLVLVRYLPAKNDYPYHKTFVYMDVDYLLPTCIESYDWDDNLVSRYLYKDLQFNVALSEDDFLPQANDMPVPK